VVSIWSINQHHRAFRGPVGGRSCGGIAQYTSLNSNRIEPIANDGFHLDIRVLDTDLGMAHRPGLAAGQLGPVLLLLDFGLY
jgi:hypothetical protein